MSSIALVMPKSTFLEDAMVMLPLGLMYLSSRLESLGHTTDFYDLNVDEFPADVYDEIWVSATSPQRAEVVKIGKKLMPYDAKAVLGGAGAWASPDSFMNLGYNLVVGGEADSPEGIRQILETGSGYVNVPVSRTLDWVVPPSRKWAGKYHSFLTDLDGTKRRCTTTFWSRGCPLECAFCESGRHGVIWDRLTRYEPLDVVEYQIKQCKELGYNALAMYDDIFPLNKPRTLKIMEMTREHGMIWRCFLRSDIINNQGGREYLKEMRDAGLVEIFVGVESADNTIKDNIHKKTTIEQDTRIVQWCKELGIRCKVSLIIGLPGESKESIETTRKWVIENRPDRVQLGRLVPFPGTPLFKNIQDYDLKVRNNVPDDWFYMGKIHENTTFTETSKITAEEINEAWHRLNKEFEELGIPK
jgi:radical SAM superfamily enzyme YgiQ (UPF0313 family)